MTSPPIALLSVQGVTLRRDDGKGSAIFNVSHTNSLHTHHSHLLNIHQDVSFDVDRGDVVIIKGPSGSG